MADEGSGTETDDTSSTLEDVAAALEQGGVFRRWVESSHAGFWVIDANASTTFVNQRMAEMLGCDVAEMLGMPLDAFMDERGKRISERNLERRRQGIEEQHDFEFLRKDGTRVFTSLETSPYLDREGNYAGAVAFVSDITERRLAEERARHLAAIVESTGDGVISLTPDGVITSWNAGAQQIFGYSREEAVGQHIGIVGFSQTPEEQTKFIAQALSGEPPVPVDTTRVRKDGREVSVSVTLSQLYDERGEVTGVAGVVKEIGDRVEAERKLLETNRLLTSLTACAGEAIFVKDADLRFRFANERAAGALGLAPEELLGKTDFDIAPPEVAQVFRNLDLEVMRTGQTMTQDLPITSPDGDERWYSETKAPLFEHGPDGSVTGVVGVVGVARDITETRNAQARERALEAQMLHAQKLESLGLLAGGIAHDFNNLLVAILGNADLAATELPPKSPVQQELAAIVQASRRASELCRQLLAYAGRGRFVVKRLELSDALSEITGLLQVTVAKRATLQLDLSTLPVFIRADVTQLRQVFMNLITNASEAMGDAGGVIRVTTGTTVVDREYFADCVAEPDLDAGTYAYFEVSDTGAGMDREAARKVFDPFFTTKATGRGLGLAAVLGIVRGHGGAIRVYSAPDEGSSFKVLLPEAVAGPDLAAGPATEPRSARGVVLVIDDEETVLNFARRALTRSGYEVLTAGSGEEGIVRFRAENRRVVTVLLDVTMPGMDGVATLAELRSIDPAVPIILSSGFEEQEITSQLAGRGLAGFLAKPYSVQDLLACLRRALEPNEAEGQ